MIYLYLWGNSRDFLWKWSSLKPIGIIFFNTPHSDIIRVISANSSHQLEVSHLDNFQNWFAPKIIYSQPISHNEQLSLALINSKKLTHKMWFVWCLWCRVHHSTWHTNYHDEISLQYVDSTDRQLMVDSLPHPHNKPLPELLQTWTPRTAILYIGLPFAE